MQIGLVAHRDETLMPYDVKIEQVEPRPMASVRRRTSQALLSRVIPEALGEVWRFIRASGISHSGLNIALYHDLAMNLECGVLVPEPFQPDGDVICSATPGGSVASTVHIGPYHLLGEAHEAILDWCSTRGLTIAGPFWELYDHWNDDPSKLRTDVFYLLGGGTPRSTDS